EQSTALLDHRDRHAQRREHASIFTPDDPTADDQHRPRDLVQRQDRIGVEDARAGEREQFPRSERIRTGRDQDFLAAERLGLRPLRRDLDSMGIDERGSPGEDGDAVEHEVVAYADPLVVLDTALVQEEVLNTQIAFQAELEAEYLPL